MRAVWDQRKSYPRKVLSHTDSSETPILNQEKRQENIPLDKNRIFRESCKEIRFKAHGSSGKYAFWTVKRIFEENKFWTTNSKRFEPQRLFGKPYVLNHKDYSETHTFEATEIIQKAIRFEPQILRKTYVFNYRQSSGKSKFWSTENLKESKRFREKGVANV